MSATVGLLLTVTSASAATVAKAYRVGSCTAEGDFATCTAGGNATSPQLLYVHVTSSPSQSVQVFWSDVCGEGTGAGSKSGQFTATTPVRRLIRHPYSHPSTCSAAASVSLADGGHLKVWISYRR
jgi:hypothetical protein